MWNGIILERFKHILMTQKFHLTYLLEKNRCVYISVHSALFVIAKNCRLLKYPSTGSWGKLLWLTMGYSQKGFTGGSVVKNSPACAGDTGLTPQVRKIPWRRAWQPTPVLLPGEFHRQRAWQAIVHGVSQGQTWLKRLSSSSIKYTNQGSSLITDGTFNKSFSMNRKTFKFES